MEEKYIGLDLGTKTLGISVSDSLGFVHPRENFIFPVGKLDLAIEHILKITKENDIFNIVLGFPLLQGNTKGVRRCNETKEFANNLLKANKNLKIYLYDEAYSTIEARERLIFLGYREEKIKKVIDMYSAVVILEDFLHNKDKGIKYEQED